MQITHFHGMTRKAYEAFKAGEGKAGLITPWVCSDNDGMMYFYSVEKLAAEYGDDDRDYLIEAGKQRAYESACLQAAIQGETEIVILCLDLSAVCTTDDYSCENMDSIADCADESSVNNSHVIAAYSAPFNQWFAPFVLRGVWVYTYFNRSAVDENLARIIELLPDDAYIDEIHSPESFDLITE